MTRLISDDELSEKIAEILGSIYAKRIASIRSATISELIGGRNPYLYRAVGPENAAELVADLLSAKAWSSIETVFGNEFFEPLAFWAATVAHSDDPGTAVRTSSGGGVDIEIETDTSLAAYAIKSGTKIFNAQSRARQLQEFEALRGRLAKTKKFFDPVVGYAYGRKGAGVPRSFREIAGQTLWEELTGESTFYVRIVEAMGETSMAHAESYAEELTIAVNKLTGEFLAEYMDDRGSIDWVRFVEFNSSSARHARPARSRKA
jgi:hypothetical protein